MSLAKLSDPYTKQQLERFRRIPYVDFMVRRGSTSTSPWLREEATKTHQLPPPAGIASITE